MNYYIRKLSALRDDVCIPIDVFAKNDDRVLYRYRYNFINRIGCVSRKFFDEHYEEANY